MSALAAPIEVARPSVHARLRAKSVAVVLGTRPEAVKCQGIVELLGDAAWVIHTGQHFSSSMGGAVLGDLGMEADVSLAIGGGSRGAQIGTGAAELDTLFLEQRPDVVVVQGDTNSTLAGALAACARDIPCVHVEAGLRSFDRRMPEELNRILVDHASDLCFAPTGRSAGNLRAEGIDEAKIRITGNTVVEAVLRMLPPAHVRSSILSEFGLEADEFVLATIHRPENTDDPAVLAGLLAGLGLLELPVVLPLHPRTAAQVERHALGHLLDGLRIVEPLPPSAFLALAQEARVIVSDSGGLQEEVTVLKRPLLVPRRSTERPESEGIFSERVSGGEQLAELGNAWIGDHDRRSALSRIASPYGDGTASERIVDAIVDGYGQ